MRRAVGAILLALLASPPARAEVPAREAFQLHCSGCHGPDGHGAAEFVPDLHELAPLVAAPGGREYLVRVPGVAQAPVESEALARLLNFILTEMSGVDDLDAFDAAEVETLRRRPFLDPVGARPVPR